jgi:hypothetical protein
MYSWLLTLFFIMLALPQVNASEQPLTYNLNWEEQLREINFNLKKTNLPTQQAEILKTFRAQLLTDINNTKDMNTPVFEKKISLFNRMNALFLDKFQKSNCTSIKSSWALLHASEANNKFEAQQIEAWLNWICKE